jgi:hypothetical protein
MVRRKLADLVAMGARAALPDSFDEVRNQSGDLVTRIRLHWVFL